MPPTSQQASINRRRQLAAALQEQSLAPIEMPNYPGANVHALSGLGKIGQALFAALGNRKLDREQAALDQQMASEKATQNAALANALKINPSLLSSSPDPMQQQLIAALVGSQMQGERDAASRAYQTGEREASQAYQTGEREASQYFRTGEREASQAFDLSKFQPKADYTIGNTRFSGETNQPIAAVQNEQNTTVNTPFELWFKNNPKGSYEDWIEASSKEGGQKPLTQTSEAALIDKLSKQWTAASKPAVELNRQLQLMDAGMAAARRGDLAQGAQAVLVTFQKILDPNSVVRDSEFDRSAAGQSIKDRVRGSLERLTVGGAGIPLDQLEKFATLAKEAARAQSTGWLDSVKKRIGNVANRYNLPKEAIFEDFDFGATGEAPATHRFNPATGKIEAIQ
jgi:hypothetical protein